MDQPRGAAPRHRVWADVPGPARRRAAAWAGCRVTLAPQEGAEARAEGVSPDGRFLADGPRAARAADPTVPSRRRLVRCGARGVAMARGAGFFGAAPPVAYGAPLDEGTPLGGAVRARSRPRAPTSCPRVVVRL